MNRIVLEWGVLMLCLLALRPDQPAPLVVNGQWSEQLVWFVAGAIWIRMAALAIRWVKEVVA